MVVISGVEFTASVGVSDFCVSPDAATLQFLNKHLDSSSQAANSYYVQVSLLQRGRLCLYTRMQI